MRGLTILFLLLGFPVLEAWILFRLGAQFGWWVILWLIVSAIAGALLIRLERLVWAVRLAASVSEQRSPIGALLTSARTVLAGVLLIFPGVITDVLAVVVLLWPAPRGGPPAGPSDSGVIEGEYRREVRIERLPPRG